MFYSIRHITSFSYSTPVRDSVMKVRMQPRSEGIQRCHSFDLSVNPPTQITSKRDNPGNMVHRFYIPNEHTKLIITAQALVELVALPPLPNALETGAWDTLDRLVAEGGYRQMLAPSHFARPTGLLRQLAGELQLQRRADPLTVLRDLNTKLHNTLTYVQNITRVDSPIDEALQTRRGVCQDFAHIMTALVRALGIPCRYVSGYLFQSQDDDDSAAAETHAWVEALLPELGWIGFDPTNNLIAGDHHIRIAIGRDYADVPPTRGVFTGDAQTELSVAVTLRCSEGLYIEG